MSGTLAGVTRPAVSAFARVQIAQDAPTAPLLPALPQPNGKIRIELPLGIWLSVDAMVDAEALARVLSVVSR